MASPSSPKAARGVGDLNDDAWYVKLHVVEKPVPKVEGPASEEQIFANSMRTALGYRAKYLFSPIHAEGKKFKPEQAKAYDRLEYVFKNGVYQLINESKDRVFPYPSLAEFTADLNKLWGYCEGKVEQTIAHQRLNLIQKEFEIYKLMNNQQEDKMQRTFLRDFYSVAKIDNHIHMAAACTAKHLLAFIKDKALNHGDDVVMTDADKHPVTLTELLAKLKLDPRSMTIDMLAVQDTHDSSLFHRFDAFNDHYQPFGSGDLRAVFLKTSNAMGGRYFAELCKQVITFTRAQHSGVYLEPRLSIYGKNPNEWAELAYWAVKWNVFSPNAQHPTILWIIQIPRTYPVLFRKGAVKSFGEFLRNIFQPLFDISKDEDKDPNLAVFLRSVVSFDSVDDESCHEELVHPHAIEPHEWTTDATPPYSYWCYHMAANLHALNRYRETRNLNTFTFRPHCGESGATHHLASAFMTAESINHGIKIRSHPSIQYLFYISRMGMSISPLSNNSLFVKLSDNPFPKLFARGLNVTLSTDDPMIFHSTQEPLVEEYTFAKQMWQLSTVDLCEIARNSVLQSGFPHHAKQKMIGENYFKVDASCNDGDKTNIPNSRVMHRLDTLIQELSFVLNNSSFSNKGIDEKVEKVTYWRSIIYTH